MNRLKGWLFAAAALLIGLGFSILGADKRRAKAAEVQRDDLLLVGSKKAKAKAAKADKRANKHQGNAVEAAKVGQAVVDKVGTENEDISSILDGWRSDGM